MGIATWASIKCEILPQLHKIFFISSEKLSDLIDCSYQILKFRLGDEFLILNHSGLAFILGEGSEQIRTLMNKLPSWNIILGIAGRDRLPRERMEFQEKDIRDLVQHFGLQMTPTIPGTTDIEVLKALFNPSRKLHWKLSYKGGCQDIFFLTTLNKTPEFLKAMFSVAEALKYPTPEIGIYIQPVHQGTGSHCEFNLPFNPDDANEVARVRELLAKASERLLEQGAFFSRPYGIWADMAYGRDAETATLLKKVKGIFDPNNILNPGKLCFSA